MSNKHKRTIIALAIGGFYVLASLLTFYPFNFEDNGAPVALVQRGLLLDSSNVTYPWAKNHLQPLSSVPQKGSEIPPLYVHQAAPTPRQYTPNVLV